MIIEDQEYKGIDYNKDYLPKHTYENCDFVECDFSDSDLSLIIFMDCTFHLCNLSNAKLGDTAFRSVKFSECKMIGLQFIDCNHLLLAIQFLQCQLSLSSFYRLKFKSLNFEHCILNKVDFTEAQIPGTAFVHSDLSGAIFDDTNIEKCDFTTAINYTIRLDHNKAKKARFSRDGLVGLMQHFDITIV